LKLLKPRPRSGPRHAPSFGERDKNSWRLKFDLGVDVSGKRQTRYVTVKGKRQDAQRELTKALGLVPGIIVMI
jgi:hypothetical protein